MEPIMSTETARLICVVEDDDAVRASARLLLEAVGYPVRDFASGEALLADAAAAEAACFLLDFQLGSMTALEVLDQLRARGIEKPAIIVTANPDLASACRQHASVLVVMRKPAPATDLLGWIEKACSRA
jgi:FixJ family two-component response regulator